MKKSNKLTALLLALLMLLSTFTGAFAAETSMDVYSTTRDNMLTLYENLLATESGIDFIRIANMSAEEADYFVNSLSSEQQTILESHAAALLAETGTQDIIEMMELLSMDTTYVVSTPAKNYTKVAPLAYEAVETAPMARMMSTFSLRSVTPSNGLELSKTAVKTATGYEITIEAYTTGSVSSSVEAVPTDIVLVLDESGSMTENMYSYYPVYELDTSERYYIKSGESYYGVSHCDGGWFNTHEDGWYTGFHFGVHWGTRYEPLTSENDTTSGRVQFYARSETSTTKQEALIAAAEKFVKDVEDEAQANNVDHRVAVVGFSDNGSSTIKVGLVDDIRNNESTVLSAIGGLKANGGTYIEDGMANAKTAFDNAAATSSTKRNRVVVVFTDGIPGSGSWGQTTIENSATPAIATAYELKNTYSATIYTIGMLDDANPELEISNETDDAARTNKFLHYLSSNYPKAASMSDGGDGGSNKGYYLAASDTASLNAIFTKISNEISTPTIMLDGDTVLSDIVTPYFDLPANTSDVSVQSFNCTNYTSEGVATWATTGTTISDAVTFTGTDTIEITGFNFNDNFVSTKQKTDGTYGKKLVIKFTVTPDANFLGGNYVYTNGTNSGVYSDGTLVEAFEQPTVDVPVKTITPSAQDQHVYLTNAANLTRLMDGFDSRIDGTNNDYATVTYQIKDGDTVIAEYVIDAGELPTADGNGWVVKDNQSLTAILDNDKEYTVACVVDGTNGGTPNTSDDAAYGMVYIYKPELTFQDSEIEYGDAVPDSVTGYSANLVSTVWKHDGDEADTSETGMGTPPAITLVHTPDENELNADKSKFISTTFVKVDVEAYIGTVSDENKITTHVTFEHQNCGSDIDCEWSSVGSENGKPAFLLHVSTGDLIIEKRGFREASESAIVTVTHEDGQTWTVVITGNNSVTLKNVPAGIYTVTEDTNWSYRYNPTYKYYKLTEEEGENILIENTAGAVVPGGKAVVTNTVGDDQWLGSDNFADNHFTTDSSGN